ncbi:Exonuclease [Streptococcus pneumoniae]|nr:Exonuclease [Streptococcus pneumoniae]
MSALKDVYQKYELDFDNIEYICSYRLAKVALPGQLNYKLKRLAKNLNIELDHHNALSDARASGLILEYLLSTNSFSDLTAFLKEYRYNKTGLLGQYGFKRKKGYQYKENPEKGVTKHTNILVVGEQDWRVVGTDGLSSKMKKAQTLLEKGQDIEIMTENDFIRLLEE